MFTKDQRIAIDTRDCNILVSAGAGSGKTAVLSERVLNLLKEGTNLDELLILTFTKAAALEMKGRIFEKISHTPELKDQLEYIDIANITTFDSYSLKLVKQYHYLLDISKDIVIGDEISFSMKKRELLSSYFDVAYNGEDPELLEFISNYDIFTDDRLISKLILLHQSFQNQLDFPSLDEFYSKTHLYNIMLMHKQLIDEHIRKLKNKVCELDFYKDIELDKFKEEYKALFSKLFTANSYDELRLARNSFGKFPRLPGKDYDSKVDVKALNDNIKDLKEDLFKIIYDLSEEEIKIELLSLHKYTKVIMDLILRLDADLLIYKKKSQTFDFADITKLSIDLLEKNLDIKAKVKNKFAEILVDEYQDTNDFQNKFINLISSNNKFLVGDVKQSIYGFRNANPDNFSAIELDYRQNPENGLVVNLKQNFRSRKEVLLDINYMFNNLMTKSMGGVDFDTSQELDYGNKTFDIASGFESNNFEIINVPKKDLKENIPFVQSKYYEPFYVGFDILKRINSGEQIFNLKTRELQELQYRDIAILTRSKSSYDDYVLVFEYLNIIIDSQKEAIFKKNQDTLFFKSLFKIITTKMYNSNETFNDRFMLNCVSIFRSFVGGISDSTIEDYVIRGTVTVDIQLILSKIVALKSLHGSSLVKIFDNIVEQFLVFKHVSKLEAPFDSVERIMHLRGMCSQFDSEGKTLEDLNEYFDYMFDRDLDVKIDLKGVDGNAVKLMTIHKSKGLEFPVVYMPALNGSSYKKSTDTDFLITKDLGLLIPVIDGYIKKNTLLMDLYHSYEKQKAQSETTRLLYVAMTRAKEKLIFVNSSELKIIDDNTNINKLQDYLNFHFPDITKYVKSNLNIDLKKIEMFTSNVKKLTNKEELPIYPREYTHKFLEKPQDLGGFISGSMKVSKVLSVDERKNIKSGIKLHEMIEKLDIKNVDIETITDNVVKNIVDNMQQHQIFNSYINIYPEFEFRHEDKIGFIDAVLEFEDHFIIMDYKLQNIDKEEYVQQLNFYHDVLVEMVDKPIKMYLYSLNNDEFKEIK